MLASAAIAAALASAQVPVAPVAVPVVAPVALPAPPVANAPAAADGAAAPSPPAQPAAPLNDTPSPGIEAASAPLPPPAEAKVEAAVPEAAAAQEAAGAVAADPAAPKGFADPFEPFNRLSYAVTQPIDRLVLRPAAMVYKTVLPGPARDGARNAISNFREPIVLINDIVQLRPKRALRTLARVLINSTLGIGGLFDIARRKPFNLPHHNNGFGDTLGYYGIGPIAYLYLPVFGPGTLRDSAAQYGDSYFQDRILHKLIHPGSRSPFFRTTPKVGLAGTAITVVDGLDQRALNDDDLRRFKEDSVDPYAALRSSYMQDRAAEIAELKARDGQAAKVEGFDDPLADPEGRAQTPPPEPAPAAPPGKP